MTNCIIETFVKTKSDYPYGHSIKSVQKNRIAYNYNEDFKLNFLQISSVDEVEIQEEMYDFVKGAIVLKVGSVIVVDWECWDEIISLWLKLYLNARRTSFKINYDLDYCESYGKVTFEPDESEDIIELYLNKSYKATVRRKELLKEVVRGADEFFNFLWKIRPELKDELKWLLPDLKEDVKNYL
ncbi:hypothetical protein HBN50_02855 [Halobacteriovorax sp. GB3]|uniref:hypothetical protein n=1 Tax=Halobacteriovorax sp. GB3 TaxID=2719615 RepID=UPI00235FA7D8|nr:hypothetical protein [Halobacteriovorax sp. GB3]MDD0852014.1 hypothetical protein [Halobacteriovorax sp. GB3]